MALRTVLDFAVLGRQHEEVPAAEFFAAEAELGIRLPSSYRDAVARFGRGLFLEERWLLPPSRLQTYGSLFKEGRVTEPFPSAMTVFAASDTGEYWAWLPSMSADKGGEPAIWIIPRGAMGGEDAATRPRVVAADMNVLLSAWRSDFVERGVVTPYFVATVSRMLASDIALLAPVHFDAVAEAHLTFGEALGDAVHLVRRSGDGVYVSRWYLPRACALVALQTTSETHLAKNAGTNSSLRIQWLDVERVDRVAPVFENLVRLGWVFAQKKPPTFVWDPADDGGRAVALGVLAAHGIC